MEWFLIWMFVCVEQVAKFLSIGWVLFFIGTLLFGIALVFAGSSAGSWGESRDFGDFWNDHAFCKLCKKYAKWLLPIGFIFGSLSTLLPTEKQMAVIVGTGVTYNVVTSETGKRLGGKAVELLEKKIDNALKDSDNGEEKKEGKQGSQSGSQESAKST